MRFCSWGFAGNQALGEFKPSSYFYNLNSKLILNPASKDILTFSFYSSKYNLDKSQTYDNIGVLMRDIGEATMETTDFTRWEKLGFRGKWSRQWQERFHVDVFVTNSNYFSNYDQSSSLSGITVPAQTYSTNIRMSLNTTSKEDNDL